MLVKSLYTHIFERNNRFYLFNSCSGVFCEISKETYSALYDREYTMLGKDTLAFLTKNKVLLEEDEKYTFYLESKTKYLGETNNDSALGLVIAPTIQCNFNCPYCFESKTDNRIMSDKVETDLINFIRHHSNTKAINLTWYGGEPLIAFDRIKSIWNRFRTELSNVKIQNHSIITNGWLIDDSVIAFFKETNLSFIQVTLDGMRENHNKTRCLKNGAPTFDKIYKNIIHLAKSIPSLDITVRVNVNKANPNDYTLLSSAFAEENLENISVYPGFIREDTPDGHSLTYNSISGSACHEFFRHAAEHGISTSFFPSICNSKGCLMSSAYAFIIGPSGEIYKCWNDVGHTERIIGYIHQCKPNNKVRLYRYLNETSAFSDSRCKECKVFPICDGGCGHYRYRNKFENGNFDLCTRFVDDLILEDSLLLSVNKS